MKIIKCFVLTVLFVATFCPTSLSSPVVTPTNSRSESNDESTPGGNKDPFQVFIDQLLQLFQSFWNRRPGSKQEQPPSSPSSSSRNENVNGKSLPVNDINPVSDGPSNPFPISGFPGFQFPSSGFFNPSGQFPTLPSFPQFPQIPNFSQFSQFPGFPQFPGYRPSSSPSSSQYKNAYVNDDDDDDDESFEEKFKNFIETLKDLRSKIQDPNSNQIDNKIPKN